MTLAERFMGKVERDRPDGCWVWTDSLRNGYGSFRIDGVARPAHRIAYEVMVGPIGDGLDIDHLCRNRACVNPDHLEPVTRSENILRGAGPAGVRARSAALTHCKHGHPYAEPNVYVGPDGRRQCRTCRAQAVKRSRATSS